MHMIIRTRLDIVSHKKPDLLPCGNKQICQSCIINEFNFPFLNFMSSYLIRHAARLRAVNDRPEIGVRNTRVFQVLSNSDKCEESSISDADCVLQATLASLSLS